MQKIVPHLWYDKEAKEAAEFYINLFDQSKLVNTTTLTDTPSGDAEIVNFELAGQSFAAISAGPYFKFNPSFSLMVACYSHEEVDALWQALSEGGTELMTLGEYPFSKWYGWIQDRFGLSWQLMLVDGAPNGQSVPNVQSVQKITPNMLFSKEACGKAEEAVQYYVSVFKDSRVDFVSRYAEGEAKTPKAQVNYVSFHLSDLAFSAMDNGFDVDFSFNEAFSLIIKCQDQAEIDYYWDKLSAVPEAEQCGWVKDQFGVSWQIVPANLSEIMGSGTSEQIKRVTAAFLKMKKFDLKVLEDSI